MKRIPFLSGIVLPNYLIIPLLFLFSSTFIHAQIGVPTIPSGGNLNGYPNEYCYVGDNQNNAYLNQDISNYEGGILEVAIDVDYPMYVSLGMDTVRVLQKVHSMMDKVDELYTNRLNLVISIVHIHIWKTPDPFYGDKNTLPLSFKNYWNKNNGCIHRDVAILLTTRIFGVLGSTEFYGNICTNSLNPDGYTVCTTISSGDWLTIAHELGHCLGSGHTESSGCTLCSDSTKCELMCSSPTSCNKSDPAPSQVATCIDVLNTMKKFITSVQKKCGNCIDNVIQTPTISSCDNPNCLESYSLTVNKKTFDNTCGSLDTVILQLKACGNCNKYQVAEFFLDLSLEHLRVVDGDGFVYDSNKKRYNNIYEFNGGTCHTFTIKAIPIKSTSSLLLTLDVVFDSCVAFNYRNLSISIDTRQIKGVLPGGKLSDFVKNGTFPNSAVTNGNSVTEIYRITGDIDIDTLAVLNDYEWVMNGGTKLTVTPGNQFVLKGCNFRSCEQMWKGIVVEDGAKFFTLKGYYKGNQNTISDAEYAVSALPGSEIRIENNDFRNNYVGFLAGFLDVNLDNFNVVRFQENLFTGTGTLKSKYTGQFTNPNEYPYAGVQLINVPNLSLINCTFDNMANGIVANNSGLNLIKGITFNNLYCKNYDIYGNGIYAIGNYNRIYADTSVKFSNMLYGMSTSGMQILAKQMTFDNVNVGISSTLLDKSIFEVEQSTFNNINYYGIFGFRNGKVKSKIKDNNITITATNVGSYTDQFGMVLLSRSNTQGGWNVKNNTINVNKGKGGIFVGLGYLDSLIENKIYKFAPSNIFRGITTNGTYNSYIGNNTVKNPSKIIGLDVKGYHASGLNNGRLQCNRADTLGSALEMNAVNNLTFLTTNQLYDSGKKALYYERGNIIGQQFLQGNRWYGSSEAYNNSIDFTNSLPQDCNEILNKQQFLINQYIPSFYPLAGLDLPQDVTVEWFTQISGTDATCSNPPIIGNPTQTEGFEKKRQATEIVGINGNNGHPLWNENTKWTAQSRLYDLLYQNPTEFGYEETLNGFMNTSNSNTMGAYATIRRWLNAPPTISEAAFSNNQANTEQVLQNLFQLDAQQANLAEPDTNLTQQQKTQLQNLANLNAQLTNQLTSVQSQLHSEGVSLLSQNSNLVAISVAQQNEKTLNEVVLTQLATSNSQLDPNQVLTVASIAAQCPINGGDAVYRARSILAIAYPTLVYNDAVICGSNISQPRVATIQAKENNFELSVLPNPSNGKFELKYTMTNEPLSCSIIGIGGNLVKKLSLDKNTNSKRIQLEDVLPNGIYQIIVQNEQQLLKSSKLVIIK